ncbi:alpha-glucosidase [Enterococcus italicus]|uniref:glycoside hydrolase family 13 protein n=1 Tax=Enterococcus italicus TaxID=246144 RepID=UPI002072EDF3|nr:alpha-glucosidase [Enterococcus italicus]MCM6881234.1 alpha-glucosidase [Enterococcus italicus]
MKNEVWWKDGVIYQIYPRSFKDTTGNGMGDIPGIIEKLDYLTYLGIKAIWLCPVYQSPNKDNGYDISDYKKILVDFGSMADMEKLIAEVSKREIRLIMDLVVNHTSDQHPWFIEARKSKENPYRDYYIWRDGYKGQVPNDLTSVFSGSAWKFDEESEQYFLHLFTEEQPDLNWKSTQMRHEIYDMMNFWLDKGIGGFRLDVIDLVGKDPDKKITANGPHLHEYLQEMNQATFGKNSNILTVGETWGATPEIGKLFSDPQRHELSMIFQFEHMMLDQKNKKDSSEKWDLAPLKIADLKEVISKWQIALGNQGWNSLFWNNHDLPRIVSRWGNDNKYWLESAKLFAILLHFLKGTPYVYQGEEIGMTNITVDSIDQVDDIEARNMYFDRLKKGYDEQTLLHAINIKGRDNARTPMQWDDSENAGFTTGKPWLPVNQNYKKINVHAQLNDPNSILNVYRFLINYRKNNPLVVYGDYQLLESHKNIFAYTRTYEGKTLLVVANISNNMDQFDLSKFDLADEVLIANAPIDLSEDLVSLPPYGAFAILAK